MIDRALRAMIAEHRDNTLDCVIEMCEALARLGYTADELVQSIRNLKSRLPRPGEPVGVTSREVIQ